MKYGSILLCLFVIFALSACEMSQQSQKDLSMGRLPAPHLKRLSQNQYGIDLRSHSIIQASFEENQFLTDILSNHGVGAETIEKLATKSEHIFDVRKMRAGNAFTLLKGKNGKVEYFIYEKNPADYVVFDLRNNVNVYEGRNKTSAEVKEIAGIIENSLYESVTKSQDDSQLAELLEDVFAWSIDLFHLEKGDFFKAIYKEEYVDDVSLGITQVVAAQFHHDGKDYYAFRFGSGNGISYLDQFGNSLKTTALQAPDTFAFSRKQTVNKVANHSRDLYPVYAIGAGTLSRVKRIDGLQVSIKHTYPYATRYHKISRLADGIRKGVRIKKGEVIGYTDAPNIPLKFLRKQKTIDQSELYVETNNQAKLQDKTGSEFEILKENMILRLARIPLSKREKQLLSSFNR